MERRDFLKAASMITAGAIMPTAMANAEAQQPSQPGQPNIIFIVSDQHRAGLTRREGYPLDTSPTLENATFQGVGQTRVLPVLD